ncbi:hypothetical protein SAICODRAFT_7093 [Saitoella complicata NRRL Y-17804]|nr:uncharacterized protein SAICODRAFT_7093 [Saitoella complicata NRRL Y-17804]ODQ53371.1 hypothetical protein SAICODRAFT_7093 [Saitoella complicata NRRL Y-17804]
MVDLTITPTISEAVSDYLKLPTTTGNDPIRVYETADRIPHARLAEISKAIRQTTTDDAKKAQWELSALMKGTSVYIPKKEIKQPDPKYLAHLESLRRQNEEKEYASMFGTATHLSPSGLTISPTAGLSPDDARELRSHLSTILNIFLTMASMFAAVWVWGKHWSLVTRVLGGLASAIALGLVEAIVYLRYLSKVEDGRKREKKKLERKEVEHTMEIRAGWGEVKGEDKLIEAKDGDAGKKVRSRRRKA